jgi:hypothetical protein
MKPGETREVGCQFLFSGIHYLRIKNKKNRIPEDLFPVFSGGFFTGTWFWRGPRNSGFWTPSQEFFAGIPAGQESLYLVRIPAGFLFPPNLWYN